MRKVFFILIFLSLIIKLYSYWRIKRILFSPIGETGSYPIVIDSDHNGYNEIISCSCFGDSFWGWGIWEYHPINQYHLVYADTEVYPPPPGMEKGNFDPEDVGDIDEDGLIDLVGRNVESFNDSFYMVLTTQESPDYHSYPESLSWWYRYYNEEAADAAPIYFPPDLDGDGRREILFYPEPVGKIYIFENINNNQNQLVYDTFSPAYSFAFGDFDLDGKIEFVTAWLGWLGRVFIYENTGDNQYQLVKVDTVRLPNGSDVFSGNDVDNDGKPEFFVSFAKVADNKYTWDFYLYMWEAVGNNNYERVLVDQTSYSITLPGGNRSKCGDIDGDGVEEIIWATSLILFCYKAIGNNQFQEVWWWYQDHGDDEELVTNIYDLNKNGYNEIIVQGSGKTSIFEIEAVQVLRPNGGEIFSGNSQEVIRWKTFYPPRCDSLSLYYSIDNGRTYQLIASGIPGRETTYLWQVPNISSDSCKIRIVAYGPGWQFDESDGVFRIRETGIKEEISKTFHIDISRNLMKDEIRLNIDNLEDDLEIEIYNLSGRLIKNYYVKPAQKVILILDRKKERIPRGIYFLKLSSKNYQKIIKFIF